MTPTIVLLVCGVELLDTTAHVLFKHCVNRFDTDRLSGLKAHWDFFLTIIRLPPTWCGIVATACGLLIWFIVLAQADLSIAFSLGSLRYLLIMGASVWLLGERLTPVRLLGTGCIVGGIVCVALSS